jgi:DNA-binding response OmpR family regulator
VARILVADDDADVRELVRALLARCAHEVDLVADGEAALDTVVSDPPDLVVLDVHMPPTDGWDTLAALKQRSDVPVLLLTGSTTELDHRRAQMLGADGYLTKPFRAVELRQRVAHLLDRAAPAANRAAATCLSDTRGVIAGDGR